MAEGNILTGMIPNVSGQQVLNGVLVALLVVLGLSVIAFFVWRWWSNRKYSEFRVVILEKDATGNTHEFYDRAGIFVDKRTDLKLLFLQRMKKGLNPNNPPYNIAKDHKGRLIKTIYLRRVGVSNFRFVKMELTDEGTMFIVGEEDANWYAQEMALIDRITSKESLWNKIAPIAVAIIAIIVIMIVLITLFNKLEGFSKAAESLERVAAVQERTAQIWMNITGKLSPSSPNPVIIPSTG